VVLTFVRTVHKRRLYQMTVWSVWQVTDAVIMYDQQKQRSRGLCRV